MRSSFHLLLLALSLATLPAAHAATKLIAKVPYTISVPGQYALAKDLKLTGSAANAITINADDVSIDLRGFTLSGDAATAVTVETTGIYSTGHNRITIRNGTLRNFARGVLIDGDATNSGDLVEDLTVLNSTYVAIQVGAANSIIRRNRVIGVGGATFITNFCYGMYLRCAASRVAENFVSGVRLDATFSYGIYVDHGRGTVIENNRIINTEDLFTLTHSAGIGLYFGEFATLDRNVSSHFGQGFRLDSCATLYYRDNTTARVGTPYSALGNTILSDGGGNL